jgi:hypothetical protein
MAEIETPAVGIADTPEFKAALAAAMTEMRNGVMTDVVTALAAAKVGGGNDSAGDMESLISNLTMAIAGMTDTGGNRKLIAPAEASRRVAAFERMGQILMRVQSDPKLKPHYAIVAQTQLEEQLIEKYVAAGDGKWQQNEIIWRGAPNSAMRPVNDIAKEIFGAYLESIGGTTKNPSGLRDHPTWVTYGGLQMVGQPSQSAANRGLVAEPAAPMELGMDLKPQVEITSVDDPNATKVPILGKTFAPAVRTAPGDFASLQFPQ